MLDAHSTRFHFPTSNFYPEKVVLLRSSYVEMRPPTDTPSLQQFTCHENLYYPDKVTLLESFIKTLLKDSMNIWRSLLACWAISYVYGISWLTTMLWILVKTRRSGNGSTKRLREGKAVWIGLPAPKGL